MIDKILVVVDFQRDFVCGSLGFEGAATLDPLIAERIRKYGEGRVFYTLDTHFDDYSDTREGRALPISHCIKGSEGFELYGETARALREVKAVGFEKNTFGLCADEKSREKLPESVGEIELCGLVSNICVLSNAVVFQTLYPQATVTVDARLTASFDRSLHEKALDVMQGLQINVINRETKDDV